MPQPTIRVIACFKARPARVEGLKAFLNQLIVPTRQEPGCLRYELHQNSEDPTDFVFLEEWESHAAIDAHMKSPHVQAALPLVGEFLLAPPEIRRYTRL
ncbi:MAG: putative quinol monooxygenase [bacterium]